jgi:two-component system, LuxR family, sensor kinase FixL
VDALIAMIRREDATAAVASIHSALAEGRNVCALRVRLTTPTGKIVHLQVHARLFRDSQEQLDRVLGVAWDVSEQVCQDERRLELQMQLREVSRHAGMAEVATGVLHNVGNLLNSLSVSTALVLEGLRDSRASNVQRVAKLITDNGDRLASFLDTDPRGREIPTYLNQLGARLDAENRSMQGEMQIIARHVDHIGKIVTAQQTHARRGGVTEEVDIAELLDNTIALNLAGSTDIVIHRDYQLRAQLTLDRHKLIQILSNLLVNARQAIRDQPEGGRLLTVRLRSIEAHLEIQVEDSGVGISPEAQARLFEFGFTTKKDGHGFGLHASANLAKELGGELSAHSEGSGRGARFTLRLPQRTAVETAQRRLA